MDTKHTPSPWYAREGQNGCWFIWTEPNTTSTADLIATFNGRVNTDYRSPRVAAADARLVSAAPELLEAVHALLEIVEAEFDDDPEPDDLTSWKRSIADATAAIAKAEGRS